MENLGSQPVDRDEEAVELAWTANAYLDCAIRLCAYLLDEEYEQSIHHNRVPIHLAYLAIELYFKAGVSAARNEYPESHDLTELRELYKQAMPTWPLPLPSFIEKLMPSKSGDLFPDAPAWRVSRHFPRFRYYRDRNGRQFPELDLADIKQLYSELQDLHKSALSAMMEIWRRCGVRF